MSLSFLARVWKGQAARVHTQRPALSHLCLAWEGMAINVVLTQFVQVHRIFVEEEDTWKL